MSDDTQRRDPALDSGDAKFDAKAFSGDVDGPGLVSSAPASGAQPQPQQDLKLKAAPPETKSMSRKGVMLMLGAASVVVLLVFWGVSRMGVGGPVEPSADTAAGTTPAGAAQAPRIDALNAKALEQQAQGGGQAGQQPGAQPTIGPPPGNLSGAPGAPGTGPSHREQYLDWLQRHQFDRLRARHMAADQAHTASLIGESSGNQPAAAARPQMAAAAMPAQAAPYTGQPRPDRIPPELLAQLATAQGQAQGRAAQVAQVAQGQGQGQGRTMAAGAGAGAQGQDRAARNEAFAESSRDVGYLDQPLRDPRPGHEIAAGSIIPAVMLSAINSDLPGAIVAQVRSDVFSTFDFRVLLIPAGSRLIGRYASDIATGQERILVAWDELILPSGRRISLEGMGAVDGQGAAGMSDQVTTHFWRIWGNALMISAIGVAAQQSQPQNANQNNSPTSSQQAAAAATTSLNETAQQVLRRNLNISPTLEIRPGYTFSVMVNQSISLPAYRQ